VRLKGRAHVRADGHGWEASELARRADLDPKTVRNIMAGRAKRVDLETIARLAETLEVPPGHLWRMEPGPDWKGTAGMLRSATPEEIEHILRGGWDDIPDPALERATRDM
jgi:DNA-binding Xre family transcriptional regulator